MDVAAAGASGDPRGLVPAVIEVLNARFGDRLRGVVLTGSVAKNEWVPFWSDLDLHAFVADLDTVPVEAEDAISLQRRLGSFDRELYQLAAIQLLFFDSRGYPRTFVPPVAGAFELVFGTAPDTTSSGEAAYYEHATDLLGSLGSKTARIGANFASASNHELAAVIRQLSGVVKDGLYATAAIVSERPTLGLALHRAELIEVVGTRVGNHLSLAEFYRLAENWRAVRHDADALRQMFTAGYEAVCSIVRWHTTFQDRRVMGLKIAATRKSKHLSQGGLANVCMKRGNDISVRTIGAIECVTEPYDLPRKIQSNSMKLELVAEALETDLAEFLKWRADDEIAASCFAHLLADVKRRRTRASN